MITILSPAKTIAENLNCKSAITTEPFFLSDSKMLVKHLQTYSVEELQQTMDISLKLAVLNFERFQLWDQAKSKKQHAICSFKGEAFNGLEAWNMSEDTLNFAQKQLNILSGLYGVLRPLDQIKPYRLEMGSKLRMGTLYNFWNNKITNRLNHLIKDNDGYLINLASNEYFKSIKHKQIKAQITTPEFKEFKNGSYRTITVYAKKARGMMARFIMENKINNPEDLKAFSEAGYCYNNHLSKSGSPVFTRELE